MTATPVPAEPTRGPSLLLLDTSSLFYRAFFSVPQTVTDGRGHPVNAVHGYLDMTARLISARQPEGVVHVHDADWRPADRVALYQGYKADRPEEPEALSLQFDLLDEVLDAFGFEQAEAPGWEAEDAIGGLCSRFTGRGSGSKRVEIVTGDRDLIQLVRDPAVCVLFTVKGVSELRVLDEAGVRERYGVPPSRYADFAILRGDPSDGLPGVRGVGEKTARLLVNAYPDLESLLADALAERRRGALLQRSPALRTAIREATGYIRAMQRIVPIRTDVELRVWSSTRSRKQLTALAKRYRLEGPIRRLEKAMENDERAAGGGGQLEPNGSARPAGVEVRDRTPRPRA